MELHTTPLYDFLTNLLKPERYPLYGIHIRQLQSPTQAFYQFCYKSENLNVLLDSLHTDIPAHLIVLDS